jgi:SAM-dependent methyltransferase
MMPDNDHRDLYLNYQSYLCKYQPAPDKEMAHRRGLWSIWGQYVPSDKTVPILDVGCGMGQWLLTLVERGYTNTEGVETSPQQYQTCLERGLNVYLTEDTIPFLAERERKYALITLFDVLEHLPRDEEIDLLIGIRRALKPGCLLVCTVPNANSIVAARWRYNDLTHEIAFTEDSLEYVLLLAGFSNIRVCEQRLSARLPWLIRPQLFDYYRRNFLRWIYRNLLYTRRLVNRHGEFHSRTTWWV